MAFTNSFRMERVYFERLKSMIDILKPYLNTETDEKLKSILENSIDDNGAILLLYRNLGECWAELSDLIKKANERMDSLDDKTEKYHDELNDRIDEVNNYIMGILREIEARLEAVEQDLATLSRNIILDLERVNDEYTLSYKGDPVDFAQLAEWVSFPDNVIIRGVVNGEETVFHLREFDTDETSGVFEFFATGLIDNVVHEITVTVLPDDSVNVATEIQKMKEYSAGNGIIIDSNDEISVDTDVIQEKLTAGSGISIDPDTHEIKNTAPGAVYTSGNSIDITNNEINLKTLGLTRETITSLKCTTQIIVSDDICGYMASRTVNTSNDIKAVGYKIDEPLITSIFNELLDMYTILNVDEVYGRFIMCIKSDGNYLHTFNWDFSVVKGYNTTTGALEPKINLTTVGANYGFYMPVDKNASYEFEAKVYIGSGKADTHSLTGENRTALRTAFKDLCGKFGFTCYRYV